MTTLKYVKLLPNNERPKIYDAILSVVSLHQEGETGCSNTHPPRYGKSSIIRCSALELCELGAPPSVVIVPWIILANQIKDPAKVADMYKRYGIERSVSFLMHRVESFKSNFWWKPEIPKDLPKKSKVRLLVTTIELIFLNEEAFIDGVKEMADQYGCRVPIQIDECHLMRKDKKWGKLIKRIQDAGGYIVMYTGTPIPGMGDLFEAEYGDWFKTSTQLLRRRYEDGELKWFKQTLEGDSRYVKNIHGINHVSWSQAWNDPPPALAQASMIWVDVAVYDEETNEPIGQLKDISKAALKGGRLRKVIESDECIAKMAEAGISRLLHRRRADNKTQMLALTGYDVGKPETRNQHAIALRDAMRQVLIDRKLDPDNFSIEIATTVKEDGSPDNDALKTIQAYIDGKVDVLIVKMMGIVGLDVPSSKILLYGSPMRHGPLAWQALSRVMTIWKNRTADIIAPCDELMRTLVSIMIEKQGGISKESNYEVIDEEDADEPESTSSVYTKNGTISGYSDFHGKKADGDHEESLAIIKIKYNIGNLTDPEIIENFIKGGFGLTDDDRKDYRTKRQKEETAGFRDLDKNLENLQGKFGAKAHQLVSVWGRKQNPRISYGAQRQLYIEKVVKLQSAAKRRCNYTGKVQDIDDATKLERLLDALDTIAPEILQ